MQPQIFRKHRIVAIAAISAAVIGVVLNAGAASTSVATASELAPVQTDQSESKKTQATFYINTPSIHASIMNELTRREPEDAGAGGNLGHLPGEGSFTAKGQPPTSMLWPAYKYVPRLSYSFAA